MHYHLDHKGGLGMEAKFKFDGSPESIPEELMDAIFHVNGFTEEKKICGQKS